MRLTPMQWTFCPNKQVVRAQSPPGRLQPVETGSDAYDLLFAIPETNNDPFISE